MDRTEITWLLKWVISREFVGYRRFYEASITKIPSITPTGFAEKYHLDCVLLERQRRLSKNPFRTHCLEIKSCKADFRSDNKWQNYIGRTDFLSFVTLPGVIVRKDLPLRVGLYVLTERGFLEIIKQPRLQEVSIEARYDTMYGLAINKNNDIKGTYSGEDTEKYIKLIDRILK